MANFHGQTVDFVGLIGDSLESPLRQESSLGHITVGSTERPTLGPKCVKFSMPSASGSDAIVDGRTLLADRTAISGGFAFSSLSMTAPSNWGESWTIGLQIFMFPLSGDPWSAMAVSEDLCRAYADVHGQAHAHVIEARDISDGVTRCIEVGNAEDYWCAFVWRRAGACRMSIYERGTGVLIGEKTWTGVDMAPQNLTLGMVGFDDSSNFPFPQTLYMTDLVLDWTSMQYPILDYTPVYTVAFNSQGGSSVAAQEVESGAHATAPTPPTRTGYDFGGWYRESGCTTPWTFASDTVSAAITLYAKWTISTHRITYDSQGGSAAAAQDIDYGAIIGTMPVPYRSGFTFQGWFTQAAGAGTRILPTTVPTAALTAYASWLAVGIPVGSCRIEADLEATDPINERSSKGITLAFFDEADEAMTPDTVSWSLYNGPGAIVNAREDVSAAPGETVRIVLEGDDNDAATDHEVRKLVVTATYTSTDGSAQDLVVEFQYSVLKITGK